MTKESVNTSYKDIFPKLVEIAQNIAKDLDDKLVGCDHIDRIAVRAKSIDSFTKKAIKQEDGKKKYEDPLNEIQDLIGARIIVFYLDDVEKIKDRILRYYQKIEQKSIVPDSEKEFGYEGVHLILRIQTEDRGTTELDGIPLFFELQIKTLYQHAFSEASHDLAYKPRSDKEGNVINLTRDHKRKVAFTSAQSWGADQIFSELLGDLS